MRTGVLPSSTLPACGATLGGMRYESSRPPPQSEQGEAAVCLGQAMWRVRRCSGLSARVRRVGYRNRLSQRWLGAVA
jgi:hypothetical protein